MSEKLKHQIKDKTTLGKVAIRAKVSRWTLGRWLKGHQPHRADAILRAVCEATGWTEEKVLNHLNHNHERNN